MNEWPYGRSYVAARFRRGFSLSLWLSSMRNRAVPFGTARDARGLMGGNRVNWYLARLYANVSFFVASSSSSSFSARSKTETASRLN